MTGQEIKYINEAHQIGKLSGDGLFTSKCHKWIEFQTKCRKALLTHSCTGALEMAALLLNLREGDEVIMPSYTFVSTANAFVLRGAIPIFVDVREDTINLNEELVEEAINDKTRAIVPVHYAGVSCEMDSLMKIAEKYKIALVEDAAQGVMAKYKGKYLGSIGHLGAYSFHETKNVISGEGGALLVNDNQFKSLAEIIREKGTDRSKFFRGEIDKYSWQNIGSSYLPSELTAAFLWAQLEEAENLTEKRLKLWEIYHYLMKRLEEKNLLSRPIIPSSCDHNAHMYYILLPKDQDRDKIIQYMKENGIQTISHYVPLHNSPAGKRFGKSSGSLAVTESVSDRILRMPMWVGLTESQIEYIVNTLEQALVL
jgi:dTDP-4-amino-4,6-dideoxygalactose transaminase